MLIISAPPLWRVTEPGRGRQLHACDEQKRNVNWEFLLHSSFIRCATGFIIFEYEWSGEAAVLYWGLSWEGKAQETPQAINCYCREREQFINAPPTGGHVQMCPEVLNNRWLWEKMMQLTKQQTKITYSSWTSDVYTGRPLLKIIMTFKTLSCGTVLNVTVCSCSASYSFNTNKSLTSENVKFYNLKIFN